MVTRLMVIFLCLGVLSTVTGCYVEPAPYGTSGVGAYQGDGMYHPWNRPTGYGDLN